MLTWNMKPNKEQESEYTNVNHGQLKWDIQSNTNKYPSPDSFCWKSDNNNNRW